MPACALFDPSKLVATWPPQTQQPASQAPHGQQRPTRQPQMAQGQVGQTRPRILPSATGAAQLAQRGAGLEPHQRSSSELARSITFSPGAPPPLESATSGPARSGHLEMPDTDVTSEGIDPLRRQVQIAGPRAGQSMSPDTSQRLAAMSEAGEAGSGPARTAHLTRRQRLALHRVERR